MKLKPNKFDTKEREVWTYYLIIYLDRIFNRFIADSFWLEPVNIYGKVYYNYSIHDIISKIYFHGGMHMVLKRKRF